MKMALKKFQVRVLTEEQFVDASLPRNGKWQTVMAKSKCDAAEKVLAERLAKKMKRC